MLANIFFLGLEVFTAIYSNIPEHMAHFRYLYLRMDGAAAPEK